MIRGLSGKKLINQIARPLPCPLNREPRHKQAGGASFRSLGVWVSDFTWRSIIERALTATKEAQFVRQKEKERERESIRQQRWSLSKIGALSASGFRHQESGERR